ncbi:MAG: FN3 associated domain-containing protein [Chitinophagaceae bacterium]
MRSFERIISNIVFSLCVLLLTAAVFRPQLELPGWLQASGRMHPVLLHFPSALLLLMLLAIPFRARWTNIPEFRTLFGKGLLLTSLATVLTALSGVFLSLADGYDADLLTRHLWLGTFTAILSYVIWQLWTSDGLAPSWLNLTSVAGILSLVVGSHFGGTLTHGSDFLSFSSNEEDESGQVRRPPVTDSTAIYLAAVQPLLQAKCYACHNENKAKGGLVMSDIRKMLEGGKSGAMWVAGDPDNSLIIERLLLDMQDRKHMPPKGRPQLTADEIELLHRWIAAGADLKKPFNALADTDSLRTLAYGLANSAPAVQTSGKTYDFEPAKSEDLKALNGPFRVIYPVDYKSPALSVAFFVAAEYKPAMLEECRKISEQIVSLKLTSMPAGDDALDVIAGFRHLELLDLNGTRLSGKGFEKLAELKQLEQISLSNTQVSATQLEKLASLSSLRKVYIWRTKATEEEVMALRKKHPAILWESGYQPDASEELTLTTPLAKDRDKMVFSKGELFEIRHPMAGVTLRYTTDGTEPDSLNSPVYKGPITINEHTQLKVIAVMQGWKKSSVANFSLFSRGIAPSTSYLLNQPENRYKALGVVSLADGLKGESRNVLLNWLGFRELPFIAQFRFDSGQELRRVTLSVAENHGQYILPPTKVTVWGGEDSASLSILGKLSPEMPVKGGPAMNRILNVDIPPGRYRFIRVQADPIRSLPAWHRGKGDKGWVFVDELFFE